MRHHSGVGLMKSTSAAVILTVIFVFPVGLFCGFLLGVYTTELGESLIYGAFAEEESADVANLKTIDRDGFQLSYPGNWNVASHEESFDIDHYFSIDSPGFSYVLFEVWYVDASSSDSTEESVEYFEQLLQVESRSEFDSWGAFSGSGVVLEGTTLGNPVRVRVFSYSRDGICFTVTEYWDLETEALVSEGFEKVRDSFVVKVHHEFEDLGEQDATLGDTVP